MMKYNLLLICMLTLSPLIKSASLPLNNTITFVLEASKDKIVSVSQDVETVVTYATSILGMVLGIKLLSYIKQQNRLKEEVQIKEWLATQLAQEIRTQRKELQKQLELLLLNPEPDKTTQEDITSIQARIEQETKALDCHENTLIRFNNGIQQLKAQL